MGNDEQTHDAAQPAYAYTKLVWFDDKNQRYEEYLPSFSRLEAWLHHKWFNYRCMHGKPIYYWHTRFKFTPEILKHRDLEFIQHVLHDHEGRAELAEEQQWFEKLLFRYGKELHYVNAELAKDSPQSQATERWAMGDQYALAYNRKWLQPFVQKNAQFKTLYHGIDFSEYLKLLSAERDLITKSYDAYTAREKRRLKKLGIAPAVPDSGETQANTKTTSKKSWVYYLAVLFTSLNIIFALVAIGNFIARDTGSATPGEVVAVSIIIGVMLMLPSLLLIGILVLVGRIKAKITNGKSK